MIRRLFLVLATFALAACGTASAARAQSAEDIAKALQDPLANIKALMTDNTFNLNSGSPDERTGYNFQVQPVYAIPFEKFIFIPRGVIPIIGAPTGAKFPDLGPPVGGPDDITWGISDIMLQTFFSPRGGDGAWKWGVGPQFSFKSRTDGAVAGPGWGLGVSGVLVGAIGPLSTSFLVNQHWGDEGDFSVFTVQPMLFWGIPGMPGATIHYNNSITTDWRIESGDTWSIPLGLGVSKSWVLGGGVGFDLSLGYYHLVSRPDGAPSGQAKVGATLLF